jgi:hypothetical protein
MNICLKAYNKKWVLSLHALIVFKNFCFKVDEKSNSKFKFAPLKLVTNYSSNPKAVILTMNYLPEAACDSVKSYRKPHFPCSQ